MTAIEFENRSRNHRLFLSALPAIGLTGALFLFMQNAVNVDEIELKDQAFRPILSVVLPKVDPPIIREKVREIVIIEDVAPPNYRPLNPLETGPIEFGVVELPSPDPILSAGSLEQFMPRQMAFERETAVPVRQPLPDYPPVALRKGLEGSCDVNFSIDAAGRPFNVEAICTDRVFESSSERAVRKAMFAAKVSNGQPVGQDNLVYPIVYDLNGD